MPDLVHRLDLVLNLELKNLTMASVAFLVH